MTKGACKKRTTIKNQMWRNRIIGHGEEAPDQLLANPRNWRIHPKAQQDALEGVLDKVGWIQDVIVNQQTGFVVDGHLRISLAISRGEAKIPVVYVDLTPDEEALVLATIDPLAGMAVAAKDALEALLADVETADMAVEGLLEDLAREAGLNGAKEGLSDPDDIPEAVESISKRGDVWLCGEHRVMCGDSTNAEDMARLMAGEMASLLWTDPPYGISYKGKTPEALEISNDGADELAALLLDAFMVAVHFIEVGSPFYIARPANAHSVIFGNAILVAGWHFHLELQWVKDSMVLGHSDYHVRHETIIYGWTPGPGRSGRGRHIGSRWYGSDSETTVFEIPRPKISREHPTIKPVALVDQHLRNSSRLGNIVLDSFLGSGTTMIAAERLGRRCYGMEIEPRYVDVAVRRWEIFTGKKAVREAHL